MMKQDHGNWFVKRQTNDCNHSTKEIQCRSDNLKKGGRNAGIKQTTKSCYATTMG